MGCWSESFTRWQAADPHAGAYATLETDAARKVMANLGWGTKATQEVRCLVCHTTPAYSADESRKHLRAEGVSCEACHGGSNDWLAPHTSWGKTPTERHGMTDLGNSGVRAKICAGCHVGAKADDGMPVRDMNHDMIAAGHPRLVFDFAEHLRRLPKHWAPRAESEANLWQVGRVASAEAACELLADRGSRQDPWPEFADFDCVACHHPIKLAAPSKTGLPRWQSVWPLTAEPGETPKLAEMIVAMQRKGAKPGEVQAKATAAAVELRALRQRLSGKPDFTPPAANRDDLVSLLHGLAAEQRDRRPNPIRQELFENAFDALRRWHPDDPKKEQAEQDARRLVNHLLHSR